MKHQARRFAFGAAVVFAAAAGLTVGLVSRAIDAALRWRGVHPDPDPLASPIGPWGLESDRREDEPLGWRPGDPL